MANKNSSKNHSGYTLTAKDQEAIDIFSDLGLPKNLAKTLLYVSNVDECRSADIERGAGLRQPEVSIAMQELSDRGWVTKRNQRKEGKGRPIYIYKLTSPLSSIMNHIEEEKSKEIHSIKQELKELKSILEKRDDFQK
jgi:predicted transcriptional regulator